MYNNAIADKTSPFMVFEYMEHGDLAELLRNNDPNVHKGVKLMDLKQVRHY